MTAHKKQKYSGFTLIELLIMIAVSIVAGGLLISLMVASNRLFIDQGSNVSQGLNLNDSITEISKVVKLASAVVNGYPAVSPQYTTGVNTLVISLPSVDSSDKVINGAYDYAVVSADLQNPKILRLLIFPDVLSARKSQNRVLSTSLSQIVFLYLDNSNNPTTPSQAAKINFTINLLEKTGLMSQTASASGQINLKNN